MSLHDASRPPSSRGPDAEPPEPNPGPTPVLRLGEPGELVAAVPHLLGVRPAESMVLLGLHRKGRRTRLGAVARADISDVEHVGTVVAACARSMGRSGPDEVALVVVGGGIRGPGQGPPRVDVAEEVTAMFTAVRVRVRTRLWVARIAAGEQWCCYPPCDCEGTVAGVDDSPVAAASAWLGTVTFDSRAELEASVAPDMTADGPRRRRLIEEAVDAAVLDRELAGPAAARRDLAALAPARDEVAAGRALGDTELARCAVALTDPGVRDAALGWAVAPEGDDPDAVPHAAELLWTTLARALPAPEVAEPASLLALTVLARGGGALVGAALDRARRADPGHRLTALIESLVRGGIGPEAIRDLVRTSGSESRARLGLT